MARACPAAALVLVLLAAKPAWGHDVQPTGYSQIWREGEVVRYDLAVGYDELAGVVGVEDLAALREATDAKREAALREHEEELGALLGSRVRVYVDGIECQAALEDVGAEVFEAVEYATMSLAYGCPGTPSGSYEAGSYEVRYDLFFDSAGVAQANLADYRLGGDAGRFVFHGDERRLRVGGASPLASAGRFVALGVDHILAGVDHVLFVLALLLGARSVRDVLKAATAFTAAHSVTLALAGMGWVEAPASVVEPLIALSIAYVAIENVVGRQPRHRLLVVFGFGLMHGLGFASTLSFADEVSWRLLFSLLTFNVGIELGQAVIVVFAFPVVLLARRLAWSRVAQVGATSVIGCFGVFWFFERLLRA